MFIDTNLPKKRAENSQQGLYKVSILRDICATETLSDLKEEVGMDCF